MSKGNTRKSGIGQRIAQARAAADLTQTALSKHIGVTRSSVSQWESEVTEPTPENLRAIAMQTEVNYDWVATGRGSMFADIRSEDVAHGMRTPKGKRTVKLKGYVGAGSEAHFYATAHEYWEDVEAPEYANEHTAAVEIRGESFGPLLNGWLVFYDDVRSTLTEDLIGEVCVVGLADDRVLLKKIERNGKNFNLLANNSVDPPIMNAKIKWAARVRGIRRR